MVMHASRIPLDQVAYRILRNGEDTLGYWLESMALCGHLFTSAEEFWNAANAYVASDMPDQYGDRLKALQDKPVILESPIHFLDLEILCRALLDSVALPIRELPPDWLSLPPDDQAFVPEDGLDYRSWSLIPPSRATRGSSLSSTSWRIRSFPTRGTDGSPSPIWLPIYRTGRGERSGSTPGASA